MIRFRSDDEKAAWDLYMAGMLGSLDQTTAERTGFVCCAFKEVEAATRADIAIRLRRERLLDEPETPDRIVDAYGNEVSLKSV